MFNQKNTGRSFGVLLGVMFGGLITAAVHHHWPGLHIALIVLIFIVLCVWSYFAGIRVIVDRPAELNKKFPISSKERQRRKKEFYDWLDSLGRR